MRIILTGDSFITRRTAHDDPAVNELHDYFTKADIRFTNLEVTTHDHQGYPAPVSGGTWAMAPPNVLDDLLQYGFTIMNIANNHTLDYLHDGLLATEKELTARDIPYAGAGRTLTDANSPRYVETKAGRAAFIGVTSTYSSGWEASDANRYVSGRPGVNFLRSDAKHVVTNEQFQVLKDVASATSINSDQELLVKEGFELGGDGDEVTVGNIRFTTSENVKGASRVREPHKADMKRLIASVNEAKRQADVVVVSIHSHEMTGTAKDQPADFIQQAAKALIDAGADCIVGHGPHILRGIDIYKGKPIFYSLGNFIFQNDSVTHLPKAFFDKYGLAEEATIADALDARSHGGTKGLIANDDVWTSVVVDMTWENDQWTQISLRPIDLGKDKPRYQMGFPTLTNDQEVINRIGRLSEPFGTKINKDGEVVC
ncbi:CapA family protein [Paenalkalicoccus suaedae]|uniref:CapA family protein n=1 Tax=Paenalkalicoccus suaedae TaxID=2592382 RepID=A0A859FHN5_9BACI|nr:CapA family protein [Paenalkalicoccus suaedae]QKS72338.1 CapA family protein [Paenalkalicoccus suaedae]